MCPSGTATLGLLTPRLLTGMCVSRPAPECTDSAALAYQDESVAQILRLWCFRNECVLHTLQHWLPGMVQPAYNLSATCCDAGLLQFPPVLRLPLAPRERRPRPACLCHSQARQLPLAASFHQHACVLCLPRKLRRCWQLAGLLSCAAHATPTHTPPGESTSCIHLVTLRPLGRFDSLYVAPRGAELTRA